MNYVPPAAWPKKDEKLAALFGSGPATLGAMIQSGRQLTATCEVCLHSARIDLGDLAARYGADHSCSGEALRPLLQCSVCRSTEAVIQETGPRHGEARPLSAKPIPDFV
jgi:hypothetical protein